MRELADAERIRALLRAFGREAEAPCRVYLTGGATAVLLGWRPSTIDVDLRIVPESDAIFRAIPGLKESLRINVELAAPSDFIPEVPGWDERSLFAGQEGKVSVYPYDPYSQALAKIERGHAQDLEDVREMMERGWVEPARLLSLFEEIEPRLYRCPAIDPAAFRRAVEAAARGFPSPPSSPPA